MGIQSALYSLPLERLHCIPSYWCFSISSKLAIEIGNFVRNETNLTTDFYSQLDGIDGYGTIWIDEVHGIFRRDDKRSGLDFNADENILYELKVEYVSVS